MIIKAGDRFPNPAGDLNADISGASVTFRMYHAPTGQFALSAAATIDDAPNGLVHYTWQAGNTDIPGAYFYEWLVTLGGIPQRFPGGENREIVIKEAAPAS